MNPKDYKVYYIKERAKRLFETGHCSFLYYSRTLGEKYNACFPYLGYDWDYKKQ